MTPFKILSSFLVLFILSTSCTSEKVVKVTDFNIDSLLTAQPENVEYLIFHGEKLLKVYDFKAALSDGAKATKLSKSKNTAAMMVYAQALSNYAERSQADIASAMRLFTTIVKKEPKNLRALIGLAATHAAQGDYERSFFYINTALKIDRKYRDAYVLKGTNFLALGNRKLAYSSYETAVQQDNKFYEGYLALAYLYTEDQNPIAIEYYKNAATLKPKAVEPKYGIAMTLQESGKYNDALNAYREILVVDSSYYFAYFNQGYIKQFYQLEIDSANYYYRKCLDVEPQSVKTWHNLGLVFLEQKRTEDARKAFNMALKYNPEYELSRIEIEKFRK